MGFEWVKTPEELGKKIEQYGERVLVALHAMASRWGQDVQNQVRDSRTWEDRTGAARSGLFYAVEGFGLGQIVGELGKEGDPKQHMTDVTVETAGEDTLIIAVAHTVFYGKFLELDHGGRHAIIMSAIEANIPELERMMADYVRALG